jgi:dCMP deaminase
MLFTDRWMRYFNAEAKLAARMSKDPSTQCGAVIVRPDKSIASKGWNGFPRRIPDDPELYLDREKKYQHIVHCEMNAILSCREDMTGYTLFTWPFHSCDRCAPHVIQSGIQNVVAPGLGTGSGGLYDRWRDSIDAGADMYKRAGLDVYRLGPVNPSDLVSRSELINDQWV